MIKPSIIITGASGFIGEHLVHYFFENGWRVKAFVRTLPKEVVRDVEYVVYDLELMPDESVFDSVDYLVHCAYLRFDQNKNSDDINVSGTKKIVEVCRRKNIKPLFLSSFSAHKDAESHYGKTKLTCEKLFDLSKDVILKPGLVIGKKGLAAELINTINRSSILPLIGGGVQPVQTIHVDDLCLIVEYAFEREKVGLYHVAEPDAITMKVFYQEIAKQLDQKIRFIPFPLPLFYFICKMAEIIGLKLPVSSESVLGLKHLIKFETKRDLEKLEITLKNYSESIKAVLIE